MFRVRSKTLRMVCEWSNIEGTIEAESSQNICSIPKGVILSSMREKHCMKELTYA